MHCVGADTPQVVSPIVRCCARKMDKFLIAGSDLFFIPLFKAEISEAVLLEAVLVCVLHPAAIGNLELGPCTSK